MRSQSDGTAANAFKGVLLPNIKVNFGGLQDTTSILRVAPVTVGTYDQIELGLEQRNFAFFDPTKTDSIGFSFAPSTGASQIINLQSADMATVGSRSSAA